jgi:hypothetical protein
MERHKVLGGVRRLNVLVHSAPNSEAQAQGNGNGHGSADCVSEHAPMDALFGGLDTSPSIMASTSGATVLN